MKTELYLAVTADGSARMTRRRPNLARDEVGIRVKLSVPDSSFRSPVVLVNLAVPEDRVIMPEVQAEALAEDVLA